jgi:hypothetical protein
MSSAGYADGAFIEQAGSQKYYGHVSPSLSTVPTAPAFNASRPPAFTPTPELATPAASGFNAAGTLQIGNNNRVVQLQNGANNKSNVGVVNGNSNNVGVLQAGYSLQSNLLLLNTSGLSVGVFQPNGSAPVNMLIARLPNGGLLIKR